MVVLWLGPKFLRLQELEICYLENLGGPGGPGNRESGRGEAPNLSSRRGPPDPRKVEKRGTDRTVRKRVAGGKVRERGLDRKMRERGPDRKVRERDLDPKVRKRGPDRNLGE